MVEALSINKEQKTKIIVDDKIMGWGKTSNIINEIINNPDKKYVFSCMYLKEVKRVIESCESKNLICLEPQSNKNIGGKSQNLKELINYGKNICMSHELLKTIDRETIELFRNQNFTLIIDEAIDCIELLDDISDFQKDTMLNAEHIFIDPITSKVTWNKDKYPSVIKDEMDVFIKIKKLCEKGSLFWYRTPPKDGRGEKNEIVNMLPTVIFNCFDEVRLLTYQFEGSVMEAYFKFNNLDYEINEMDSIELKQRKKEMSKLITIIDKERYNRFDDNLTLSFNCFKEIEKKGSVLANKDYQSISNTCDNVIAYTKKHFLPGLRREDHMWTCPKSYKEKIVGVTVVKNGKNKTLPGRKKAKYFTEHGNDCAENETTTFVSCNVKATNDYAHKRMLLYILARHMNPNLYNFFHNRGIPVSKEIFALNELIQWVWRSAIRNDQKIVLFLPSLIMRRLFIDWLKSVDQSEESIAA